MIVILILQLTTETIQLTARGLILIQAILSNKKAMEPTYLVLAPSFYTAKHNYNVRIYLLGTYLPTYNYKFLLKLSR